MSRWWLQDCRSDPYIAKDGEDEEEQMLDAPDPGRPSSPDASPPQVSRILTHSLTHTHFC